MRFDEYGGVDVARCPLAPALNTRRRLYERPAKILAARQTARGSTST